MAGGMSTAARTRIGKVTLKAGGSVRLLREPIDKDRLFIEGRVRKVLDSHANDFAGFAFMVWGEDNKSTCTSDALPASRVPNSMIPDFVRARLFTERTVNWSVDFTLESLGYAVNEPEPAA